MMHYKGNLAVIAALVAGIALLDAAAVRAQTLVEGTVEWARRASLGIPVTGVVARVTVAPGDPVEQGQELVALESGRFDAAAAAARAQVEMLDPDVAEARREFERAEDMFDRTLISEHDLALARVALARVEARSAHAKAMLGIAEIDRARSALRAPFDGVVVERRVEVGEVVNAEAENAPLVVVGDPSRLLARARLEEGALSGWSPGAEATVLIGERRIGGTVRHVALEPTDGGAYTVDVEFEPAEGMAMRIGQRVRIERR